MVAVMHKFVRLLTRKLIGKWTLLEMSNITGEKKKWDLISCPDMGISLIWVLQGLVTKELKSF